jgi:hypothetical protein
LCAVEQNKSLALCPSNRSVMGFCPARKVGEKKLNHLFVLSDIVW